MRLTRKIIKEVLTKEIEWTFEHPADNLSRDFQKGFRTGLKQSINILIKITDLKERSGKMENETSEAAPKDATLFGAIRSLRLVTAEIEAKLFGGKQKEEAKKIAEPENSIVKARNKIVRYVEILRKVNRALEKLDKK